MDSRSDLERMDSEYWVGKMENTEEDEVKKAIQHKMDLTIFQCMLLKIPAILKKWLRSYEYWR